MVPEPQRGRRGNRAIRTYVVMVEIVNSSPEAKSVQIVYVDALLDTLFTAIHNIDPDLTLNYDVFPTGDGAILSMIDPLGVDDGSSVDIPFRIACETLALNRGNGFAVKVSINYSPQDFILDVSDDDIVNADGIQIGNGINMAQRVVHFAEPNEIIATEMYRNLLADFGKAAAFGPVHGYEVFVMHSKNARIWAYRPDHSAHPKSSFRKYAYFPPLRPDTVQLFEQLGLSDDLVNLCDFAYDSIDSVNRNRVFISAFRDIYDLLDVMTVDSEALIVSRSDLDHDFWSTPRSRSYLRTLMSRREKPRQRRLFVYDPIMSRPPIPDEVLDALSRIHSPGSIRRIRKAFVQNLSIFRLIFGVTLFPELGCAVAPIPQPESYDEYLATVNYSGALNWMELHSEADFETHTFRPLIIANDELVTQLQADFDALWDHRSKEDVY